MARRFRLNQSSLLRLFMLGVLIFALSACGGEEEEPAGKVVGEVVFINGTVNVLSSDTGEIVLAEMQAKLLVGDRIAVEENGLLRFDLDAGTLVYAMPLTVFNIDDETPEDVEADPIIDLEIGQMWVLQPKGSMTVKTPLGNATTKQGHMRISYSPDQSKGIAIDCLSGTCEFATLVDTFTVETGESIRFNTSASPEEVFQVQDDVVKEWLAIHPLATMLLPELSETPTPPIPQTPVVVVNGTECPIPAGWQAALVGEGQTLQSIAEAYNISLAELAGSNCLDEGAEIVGGSVVYVPVIQQSLTFTPALTVTFTPTLTPTITLTPTPTVTPTIPSPTPAANQNTEFIIQEAPYTSISDCNVTFRIKAIDPETVSTLKVQTSINDPTFAAGQLINLPHIGDNVFQDIIIIDTSEIGADLVYWRLMSTDMQNNVQFYPDSPYYNWYSDSLDCTEQEITKTPTQTPVISQTPTPTATPTPTGTWEETPTPDGDTPTQTPTPTATVDDLTNAVFSNPIGPRDVAIVNCLNTYSVEVTDPDGVDTLSIQSAVNDETFSHSDSIPLTHQGVNLYGDILRLDTSASSGPDVVYWRFELLDGEGNTEFYPPIPYSYTGPLDCSAP